MLKCYLNNVSKGHSLSLKKEGYITPDVDCHSGDVWKMTDSVKNLGSKETRYRIGD